MRNYELTMILTTKAAEEGEPVAVEKVSQYVTQKGGVVSEINHWGRRKLAYPIQRFREGHYVLALLQLEPEWITELEESLELSDEVLRYLLVRREG